MPGWQENKESAGAIIARMGNKKRGIMRNITVQIKRENIYIAKVI